MNASVIEEARAWLANDPDDATRAELGKLIDANDERELRERFGASLEFGTAGLRGIVGAGRSRMNRAVVIRTTAGLAKWVLASHPDAAWRGVIVGRDARHGSDAFAHDTAAVLAAHGIRAHVFEPRVPTPMVAFAVRALGAAAGVMVTASHNPPQYNGYKVYAGNGAQIISPADALIAAGIEAAPGASSVPRMDEAAARAAGLWIDVPAELFDRYHAAVKALSVRDDDRAITIVYTAMHGVGDRLAREVFARLGYSRVISVPEQAEPDPAFPTVKFPNPEEPGAMDLSLALAEREKADVVIANDPDADRLAAAVPRADGTWQQLSGNEVGVLLGHYLLTEGPPGDRLVVTTIVSSPQLSMIARALGVRYEETLTGFKWIANRAMEVERETGARFVMGYEEALGYCVGTAVRDKDGISAAAVFAELVASLRARGQGVLDRLEEIHRRFGLVVSKQHNVTHLGAEGSARIAREMSAVRRAPPQRIGAETVVAIRDYLEQRRVDLATQQSAPLALPKSNVLAFELAGGSRITMRPSGTEPKIKYYLDAVEPVREGEPFAQARARADAKLTAMTEAFVSLVAALSSGA